MGNENVMPPSCYAGRAATVAGHHDLPRISWSRLGRRENDAASSAALRGDTGPLIAMFEELVTPL
jgi:hypothetical protein